MKQIILIALVLMMACSPKTSVKSVLLEELNSRNSELKAFRSKKQEFEITYNLQGRVQGLSIDTIETKCGYSLDLHYRQGHLNQIRQRRCLPRIKHRGGYIGLQIELYDNGLIAHKFYCDGIDLHLAGECNLCGTDSMYEEMNGRIKSQRNEAICKYGTGQIRFFIPPGRYFVVNESATLYADPDLKSKRIVLLHENDEIEVLNFSAERIEFGASYAPWAQVKVGAQTGWIHGGLIAPKNYSDTYDRFVNSITPDELFKKLALD